MSEKLEKINFGYKIKEVKFKNLKYSHVIFFKINYKFI